ncbi:MAG: DUF3347 domain-containing protein [bacterium]|nr:DUF3347 domain-containing protein [bacterium]
MNNETLSRLRAPARKLLRNVGIPALVIVGIVAGFRLGTLNAPPADPESTESATESKAQVWTCSMHPQVRQPGPGICPLCPMELIPVMENDAGEDDGTARLTMSEASKRLAQVRTAPVERRFVTAEIRMLGKVNYDETRLAYITAWVPGRIERLYADYTGMRVSKGDHMVDLFSPDLLTAYDELRRAVKAKKNLPSGAPEVLRGTAEATLGAVRSKLKRWGLTKRQIATVEEGGAVSDRITIYAPIGGTVIERAGNEGAYVDTGARIYAIADLGVVWVELDAYESDLPWLHYGQPVTFTAEAYPDETFEGRVAFIAPMMDTPTRTVNVRVNVPNPDGRLRPGMFVRGTVRSQVATGGRVMDPGLAGKWVSPMHPEVVKDGPGSCDVCGMALVRAEDLGYVPAAATDDDKPLVIPVSAPLITGRRAVVYVEMLGTEKPTYEGREVTLGPRAGDFYLVKDGLAEGERVVVNGNFKIDSALQIQAKPSMMTPPAEGDQATQTAPTTAPASAFGKQLRPFVDAYLGVSDALAHDDAATAQSAAKDAMKALHAADAGLLSDDLRGRWNATWAGQFHSALTTVSEAPDLAATRTAFQGLSNTAIEVVKAVGLADGGPIYEVYCPMAFDDTGAAWLQGDTEVRNPYFGSGMYRCGAVREELFVGTPMDHEGSHTDAPAEEPPAEGSHNEGSSHD